MISSQRWMMRDKRDVVLEDWQFDETGLAPRELALEVEYTAISPGTECANYLALDPDVYKPQGWCKYPWQPGYAGVGRIIGKGDAVDEYSIGDRVVGIVKHGRHFRVSADDQLVSLHPQVAPEVAAHTRLVSIAMTALQVLHADPMSPAAVWGLGMIGNLVAQNLRVAGFQVAGVDPVEARRVLAARCGIETTFDPTAPDFAAQLKTFSRGEGLGVGVDTTGQSAVTVSIPSHIAKHGQMVLMTHWRSQPMVDASDFVSNIFGKAITLHGALEGVVGSGASLHHAGSDWAGLQRSKYARIQHQMATGGLKIEPLISHVVSPKQCSEAYEGLSFDRDHWWGVAVDWREN